MGKIALNLLDSRIEIGNFIEVDMKKWLIALGMMGLATVTYAKGLTSTLYLNNLKADKTVEKQGDELYFAVTEFPSTGKKGSHVLIPAYPMYMQSKHLDKVKDLKLWQKTLQPGQSVELVVSLVEHDVPPWNTDDLIGAFKLQIANKDGKIITRWSKMDKGNHVAQVDGQGDKKAYTLTGEGASYQLNVELK